MDYSNIPAATPPPGVISDFDHPRSLSRSLVILNVVFLSLMLIVVAIRLYSRTLLSHAVGWDDFMCLLAALCSAAHSAMMFRIIAFGYGRHLWDIRAITLLPSRLQQMGSLGIIGSASTLSIKISILLLYLRLFGINRNFRYWVYFGMFFCCLYTAVYWGISSASINKCNTPQSQYIALCANSGITTLVMAILNIITDFYALALPIRMVTGLSGKQGRKVGLIAVFLCGVSACIANLLRLIIVSLLLNGQDVLWSAVKTSQPGIIEMNLGIVAASMPALPHFFAKSRIFHASTYSSLRRLLNKNDPISSPWFGEPSKDPSLREPSNQHRPLMPPENWTELQCLSAVHLCRKTDKSQDDTSLNELPVHMLTQIRHEEA